MSNYVYSKKQNKLSPRKEDTSPIYEVGQETLAIIYIVARNPNERKCIQMRLRDKVEN